MDVSNLEEIVSRKPTACTAKIQLFGDFSLAGTNGKNKVIRDPYYGQDDSGFELVYDQCYEFSTVLISHLQAKKRPGNLVGSRERNDYH